MVLWAMLGVATLIAFANLATTSANGAALRATREQLERQGYRGVAMAVTAWAAVPVLMSLWVVYAVQQGDWRLAAIPLLPWISHVIGRLAIRSATT